MPSLLLHATAIERLADGPGLPPQLTRALAEDIEYARFGALLPDLPWCEGFRRSLSPQLRAGDAPRYARLFHERAPVRMGLKMAELVESGALVGREAGLAVVCGYFTHLSLDRHLHPFIERLAAEHRVRGESPEAAYRRIEWGQGVLYMREAHGQDLVGSSAVRAKFRLSKTRVPTRGIGRGLYELVRLSAQETLQEAPPKREMDSWVRGAFLQGALLASPLGWIYGTAALTRLAYREIYRGDDVDFPGAVEAALNDARAVLARLYRFIDRGIFSPRSRARFLDDFPEGAVSAYAA